MAGIPEETLYFYMSSHYTECALLGLVVNAVCITISTWSFEVMTGGSIQSGLLGFWEDIAWNMALEMASVCGAYSLDVTVHLINQRWVYAYICTSTVNIPL